MKKILSTILFFSFIAQITLAFSVDTSNWVDEPNSLNVNAVEIMLDSDLKNDFRVYQVTVKNKNGNTVDAMIPTNATAAGDVESLIKNGVTLKKLMQLPAHIAVESYKEDVGSGAVAKAHKGLIYVVSTAGAACAGAGFLGFYPQQKIEEYFSHKKMKKEFEKYSSKLIDKHSFTANEEKDFVLFVPMDTKGPYIITKSRNDADETIYSEYHQL